MSQRIIVCGLCGKAGHWTADCPVPVNAATTPAPTAQAVKVVACGAPPLSPEGIADYELRGALADLGRTAHRWRKALLAVAECETGAPATDAGKMRAIARAALATTPQADAKANLARAAHSLAPEGIAARLAACGWDRPVLHGDKFTWWDDGDPHGKVYLVCPGGLMVPFGSCEGDIDEQRVRFIMDACNAVLGPKAAQSGGAPALPRPEATAAPEGLDARLRDALTKSHLALADLSSRIQCTAGGFWQVRHPHSEMQAVIAAVDEAMLLYHAVTRASVAAPPTPEGTTAPGAVHWECPRCGRYFPSLCASRDPLVLMCRACAEAEGAAAATGEAAP